jgi:quercetin dioxygenase-like cupin family protein
MKTPKFFTPEIHKKGWGQELWIDNREETNYCCKLLEFKKGSKFSMHYHLEKRETFYVLKGDLIFSFFNLVNADEISKELKEGDCLYLDTGIPHQIEAITDSTIIEVSTLHKEEDNYRIKKGNSQKC